MFGGTAGGGGLPTPLNPVQHCKGYEKDSRVQRSNMGVLSSPRLDRGAEGPWVSNCPQRLHIILT